MTVLTTTTGTVKSTVEFLADAPWVGPEGYDPRWDDLGDLISYYDREGEQISMRTYFRLKIAGGQDYKRVASTTVGRYWISTVWLGYNHAFGDGPPIIFETMVFSNETGWDDLDMERYYTEEEALAGHAAMVEKVRLLADLSS
jgi:hypothetical protein